MTEAGQEKTAKSAVRMRYTLIGTLALVAGLIFVSVGVVWGITAWSDFNQVGGGSFLGGFLAYTPSVDYDYTVVIFLDLIVVMLGLILSSTGAIALNMGSEQ